MSDDWRIRVELGETANAEALLGRLGVDLAEESRRLAEELKGRRLAVSNDDLVRLPHPNDADAENAIARSSGRSAVERHGIEGNPRDLI